MDIGCNVRLHLHYCNIKFFSHMPFNISQLRINLSFLNKYGSNLPTFTTVAIRLCLIIILSHFSLPIIYTQHISGEKLKWHKLTIDFEGPMTDEKAMPNPFTYFRLDVVFTHESGTPVMVIPGFYATDGNSQNTSATSGNKWRVHFSPPKIGKWKYEARFKAGEDAAVLGSSVSAGYFDGKKGEFVINNNDKKLPDNRAHGRLEYVGKRYLKYAETGEYMLKAGADSPENMLHYRDFDGTLDGYGKLGKDYLKLLKTWDPHAQDFEKNASKYTWKDGKGKNILGAVNYLNKMGMNAFSFLTFSVDGDDGCVYPYLVKEDSLFIKASQESKAWEKAIIQDRFDVSKLAQWEQVFDYAETKGMFLHFKTFENEAVSKMGRSELSRERKLYYRELIARFSHHLALNWNLGEETNVEVDLVKQTASYIRNLDPYKNHVVQHTFPFDHKKDNAERPNFRYYYDNLVGFQSELTGASLQLHKEDIHDQVKHWVKVSEQTGKPWVICNDEQGKASDGVTVDFDHPSYFGKLKDNTDEIRCTALWATLMAGGMGVEYYYGYQCESNDLNNEDHRSRARKYEQAKIALDFLRKYLPYSEMSSMDELTQNPKDYVFAKKDEIYCIYIPANELSTLILKGKYDLQWFDPRSGKMGSKSILKNLNKPDQNDWVALITAKK